MPDPLLCVFPNDGMASEMGDFHRSREAGFLGQLSASKRSVSACMRLLTTTGAETATGNNYDDFYYRDFHYRCH